MIGPQAAKRGLKNPPKPRETPIAYINENTNPMAKLIPTQNRTPPWRLERKERGIARSANTILINGYEIF